MLTACTRICASKTLSQAQPHFNPSHQSLCLVANQPSTDAPPVNISNPTFTPVTAKYETHIASFNNKAVEPYTYSTALYLYMAKRYPLKHFHIFNAKHDITHHYQHQTPLYVILPNLNL